MLTKITTLVAITCFAFSAVAVAAGYRDYSSGWMSTNHRDVEFRWKRHDFGTLDPSCEVDIAYRAGRANINYTITYRHPRDGERTVNKRSYLVSSSSYGGDSFSTCSAVTDVEVQSVEPR